MNIAGMGERKIFSAIFSILWCFHVLVAYQVQLKKELAELFVSSVIWPVEKQIGGDPGSKGDPEFFLMLQNYFMGFILSPDLQGKEVMTISVSEAHYTVRWGDLPKLGIEKGENSPPLGPCLKYK